ncbi:putative wall associated kinase-like 2 [Heracleum sosnowskyi]|uniref:Wall associated kinase-like 2 n=1 Tax=Heracleum sosnowskyi TaxID=360622 RepID=A0AAD8MMJ4_9APIA|nr:putative wall associated kinase-like 2 [Heracleum sosnowskyi]
MTAQLVLQIMLVLLFRQEALAQESSRGKPGCQQKCGSLLISYPFGLGASCSADRTFELSCNKSFNPPKAFLVDNNLEVLYISLKAGTIRVNTPVITDCMNTNIDQVFNLRGPFTFSATQNRFTAMACNNIALISQQGLDVGMCTSFCNITGRDNSCYGINCCQIGIPPSLKIINASLRSIESTNDQKRCRSAFIVDQNWFGNLTNIYSVQKLEQVPAVLDWRPYGFCHSFGPVNSSLCGSNTVCTNQRLCSCIEGYKGNPYLPDGCHDIDECANDSNRCQQICTNTPGKYKCSCIDSWEPEGQYKCMEKKKTMGPYDYKIFTPTVWLYVICISLVLAPLSVCLFKVLKRRKQRKIKEKFFKRNGGMLLHQQMSSSEGNVETNKLFSSKELHKATNHYNVDRILGQGGQGTVYKGMLPDGRIVAVKKSKIEDERKLENFINEIVILSQLNHRNVVRLHGCCLETEVPLLVYEFIPNGTLFEYLHDHRQKPILAPTSDNEERSLVTHFMLAIEENRIVDVVDSQITKDGRKEELITFAKLAYRCLNFSGRRRPTMKQVSAELESIRMSDGSATAQQHSEIVAYSVVTEQIDAWDLTSTSISSSAYNSLTQGRS